MPTQPVLPIFYHKGDILKALKATKRLLLSAPTGSGKSTQVPKYLLDFSEKGKIIVLEPRRIAAIGLCHRVAEEIGEAPGATVGYQVRGDSKIGDKTRVIFQTYGWFFQNLASDPRLEGVSAVVLDEFHERQLEMDACLGWVKLLQENAREDIGLIVMSATLGLQKLQQYLGNCSLVDVPGRLHEVQVSRQRPSNGESVWAQVSRAFLGLRARGVCGTVLVFLPGKGEISRVEEALLPDCGRYGWECHLLHGSLNIKEQKKVLAPASAGVNRVVLATNVAESSLTIPGVTAVIDSGMARVAGFDSGRGLNTLYLRRISKDSAEQRKGRAGRTGPGVCIRLWDSDAEAVMEDHIVPEVTKLDLAGMYLRLSACLGRAGLKSEGAHLLKWLDTPDTGLWTKARETLGAVGALDALERITDMGYELCRYPLHPRHGVFFSRCLGAGAGRLGSAVLALVQGGSISKNQTGNLLVLSRELLSNKSGRWPREVLEGFAQLERLAAGNGKRSGRQPEDIDMKITRFWADIFPDFLGVRENEGAIYHFADGAYGRAQCMAGEELPAIIIAAGRHEIGGSSAGRRQSVPHYFPCPLSWLKEWYKGKLLEGAQVVWDEKRKRVNVRETLSLGTLVLESREGGRGKSALSQAEDILVEKMLKGEIKLKRMDDSFFQWVYRLRALSRVYPDFGYPVFNNEDWELFYHELASGNTSLAGLDKENPVKALERYIGPAAWAMLKGNMPGEIKLPGGRKGRYIYFEEGPPELSARLGDFLGMEGEHYICDGKIKVTYNILAPNYRTVQKTEDLSGFWKNTYPEVKKELKRRYPRHPWP